MSELTKSNVQKLRHMLGADDRYLKKDWGFRNYFEACHTDFIEMNKMVADQYLRAGSFHVYDKDRPPSRYYFATIKGAKAIGFKAYQIAKMRNKGVE